MTTDLINDATQKLSPFKKLTAEQNKLVNTILQFTKKHIKQDYPAIFTVYGDAGTGKSVVLAHLFNEIQVAARTDKTSALYGTTNYFVVNHPEILKVYKEIAGNLPHLYKKDFTRPTSLINQLDKRSATVDLIVIDEAHLLLSRADPYNNFTYQNQLVELIKRAKIVILVFDPYQVLRTKSFWTTQQLEQITHQYPHEDYHLTHQFRVNASDELLEWFNHFTDDGKILPFPQNARQNYDFRIFDDAEKMRQEIVKRNNEVGLSRILSTTGYPSTLDGGKHYITEGKFKMPWDQYNYTSKPWAEIPKTINEVGSIYTCQGFNLNYTGIILSPPISQIPGTNRLQIDPEKFTDIEAFKKRKDLFTLKQLNQAKKRLFMNMINVLFKRGVYGTYIYAHDPLLRQTLYQNYLELIEKK
ncbi:DNA replication initiation protein [Lactobacillus kefiranofaciens]|uniref:DUF2075 domain-containing protein n=1 Tax=Lactobacillus kefiranofaciens TaxID=267818 RepID=UPI000BA768B4|nr:DUF2075 domain-containing protein [Lactobacillus kefiranofaciens]PAK98184.1 DNA replication initiation protein [Lactobacillus kefiranofaciens]